MLFIGFKFSLGVCLLLITEEECFNYSLLIYMLMQLKDSGLFQAAVGKCPHVLEQSPQEQSCRDRIYDEVSSCHGFSAVCNEIFDISIH